MPWAWALFPTTFCIQHKLYSADRVPLHELLDITCRVDGPPDFHPTQHIPLFRVLFLSFKQYGQI